MLGWIALIGRTISFTIEKIATKAIDLTTDQRRKAARQFFGLYYAVADLELLSKELLAELRDMNQLADPTLAREWLRDISVAVDETSQRFLEATLGLHDVLQIFDPVLASTVSGLEAHKFSFLLLAAQGFEYIENDQSQEIKYTHPGKRADQLDLAKTYHWYADRYPLESTKPSEWPDDVLSSFVDDSDVESDRAVLRDPDSMLRLTNLLEQHLRLLSAARENLEAFLRQRFNLEDLLSLQKPVSKFDRIHAMHRMSSAVGVSRLRWFAGKPVRKIQSKAKDKRLE